MAYLQHGSGHYDVALLQTDDVNVCNTQSSAADVHSYSATETKPLHCTCGKNDKSEQLHCKPIESRYATLIKCKCLQSGLGCSSSCKCKNCSNPKGKKNLAVTPPRKRRRHDWQINVPKSVNFARDLKETVPHGGRSIFEFFTLECILKHCIQQEIATTTQNVALIYNAAVEVAQASENQLPIANMDIESVDRFFREHQHNLLLYQSLCVACIKIMENKQ